MKKSILLGLIVMFMAAPLGATGKGDHDAGFKNFEDRYDDLRAQLYDIKHDLRAELRDQERTIKEQGVLIDQLQLKIKDLESELFQTTQSLRNLELEVWDMKKSRK